jgi:thioredoxin-dependent peroxiredoxin
MIVTGKSVIFPLGVTSINPRARGPVSFFARDELCPNKSCATIKARPAQMTPRRAIRYNGERALKLEGEASMGSLTLKDNDKAPEFTLPDQDGKVIKLKDYRGQYVVLYFYPRADTPGCTIESCEFRDSHKKIEKVNAVVLGISPDTSKDQKKFEEKFSLPFTLLADADKTVCNLYGVMQEKNMYGKKVMGVARTTFIIGPDGKIKHIFEKVKPEGHAEEVLAYLKEAAKGAA